jgi:hypothetical protein
MSHNFVNLIKINNEITLFFNSVSVRIMKLRTILGQIQEIFCSPESWVILILMLLLSSGLFIYIFNKPPTPSFFLDEASFLFDAGNRKIECDLKVTKGEIELKQFFLNNNSINTWFTSKKVIRSGEVVTCVLEYPWKMGKVYKITLKTMDERYAELVARAPELVPNLELEIINTNSTQSASNLQLDIQYQSIGNGTDSLHMILFTYLFFERQNRPIYIFYDSRYMADESIKRADCIVNYFNDYKINIIKTNYESLEKLSIELPNIILIIVDPLITHQGNKIRDALPAPLLDPNYDGYIRDNSKYGKSILYDWMVDKGLILITVGSITPHQKIFYSDGIYQYNKDSYITIVIWV